MANEPSVRPKQAEIGSKKNCRFSWAKFLGEKKLRNEICLKLNQVKKKKMLGVKSFGGKVQK